MTLSNNQIDKLGDRLKSYEHTDEDLFLLDQFCESFCEAHEYVVGTIYRTLGIEPTERIKKSLPSTVAKLNRGSTRLSKMQDISGCRLIVFDMTEQDAVVKTLKDYFNDCKVNDIRNAPHHGYRAVHLIVKTASRCIEVQVRTLLQDQWAALSDVEIRRCKVSLWGFQT